MIQHSTFLEISTTQFIKSNSLSSCKIQKGDDDYWRVVWQSDDGEMLSSAFASKKKAKDYIDDIVAQMPPPGAEYE